MFPYNTVREATPHAQGGGTPPTTQNDTSSKYDTPAAAQNEDSVVVTDKPDAIHVDSASKIDKPATTQSDPMETRASQAAIHGDILAATNKPTTTQSGPFAATDKPTTTKSGPFAATDKPTTTQRGQLTATDKPATIQSGPFSATDKPTTTQSGPLIATDKPATTQNNPMAARDKPAAIQGVYLAAMEQHETTQGNPMAKIDNPAASQRDHLAANDKPATTQTVTSAFSGFSFKNPGTTSLFGFSQTETEAEACKTTKYSGFTLGKPPAAFSFGSTMTATTNNLPSHGILDFNHSSSSRPVPNIALSKGITFAPIPQFQLNSVLHSQGSTVKHSGDVKHEEPCSDLGKIKCPLCTTSLNEPQMLQCYHIFCSSCSSKTDMCPICDQRKDKPVKLLNVKWLKSSNSKESGNATKTCAKCSGEEIQFYCNDCKDIYCKECKVHHDAFKLFQLHTWQVITDSTSLPLDELVVCVDHPSRPAEFYCQECERLSCLLCNGTVHKSHTAVSIECAFEKTKSELEHCKSEITILNSKANKNLEEATKTKFYLEAQYQKVIFQLNKHIEERKNQLDKEHQAAKISVQQIKQMQDAEIDKYAEYLRLRLRAHQTSVDWVDEISTTHTGGSFIDVVQSGLRLNLVSLADLALYNEPYQKEANVSVQYQKKFEETCNVLNLGHCSRIVKLKSPLRETNSIVYSRSMPPVTFNFPAKKVVSVFGKLFVFGEKSSDNPPAKSVIHVVSFEGNVLTRMTSPLTINSLLQVGGVLLIGASEGLYVAKNSLQNEERIQEGNFVDMCAYNGRIYCLNVKEFELIVLNYSHVSAWPRDRVSDIKRIKIQIHNNYQMNSMPVAATGLYICGNNGLLDCEMMNSMQVAATGLYICGNNGLWHCEMGNLKPNITGFGAATSGITCTMVNNTFSVRICGADADGALLLLRNKGLCTLDDKAGQNPNSFKSLIQSTTTGLGQPAPVTHGIFPVLQCLMEAKHFTDAVYVCFEAGKCAILTGQNNQPCGLVTAHRAQDQNLFERAHGTQVQNGESSMTIYQL